MKIKSIYVNNFKSLVDFKIDLTDFNCLVGVNGSGKSTFLEFVDFLVHLMIGDVEKWLRSCKWNESDLFNPYCDKKISFKVEFCDDSNGDKVTATWSGEYTYKGTETKPTYRLDAERVVIDGWEVLPYTSYEVSGAADRLLSRERKYAVVDRTSSECSVAVVDFGFNYQGSILSVLDDERVPQAFYDVRDFILSVESVGVLSPYLTSQPTRLYIDDLDELACGDIVKSLAGVYPQLQRIQVKEVSPVSNWREVYVAWRQLHITEQFQGKEHTITSDRVSGGLLRLLAILAQLNISKKHVVLFDEIENGIDPEKIEFLVKTFVNTKSQTVVTTHSPLFLNYMDDDTARKAIKYFYKTQEGYTQCIPFFDIPYIAEKLGVMGAGEAYADTDLTALNVMLGHPDTRKQLLTRTEREEN
jgi:ABC-type lipoprotein export system ATPase subunit